MLSKKKNNTGFLPGSRQDRKIIIGNITALSLVKITDYVIPLITLPYLARVIGVEKFGVIIFSQAFVQYFISLVEYGFNFSGTRAIAQNRNNRENLECIFSRICAAKIVLMVSSFLFFIATIYLIPMLRRYAVLHLFTFGLVIGEALLPAWFFQGMERMQLLTILNCSSKLLFAVILFTFVKSPDDFLLVNLFYSFGAIAAGITGLVLVYRVFGIRLLLPSLAAVAGELRRGFYLFVGTFMPTLYNNTSTFILGLAAPEILVGYYAAAMKVINLVTQFITILSRVFYPFLSRRSDEFIAVRRTLLITGAALSLILVAGANPIITVLFSARFSAAIPLLRILSVGIFMLAVMAAYGTNYLLVHRKDRLYMLLTVVASIVGFVASLLCIPLYHHHGAAWTLTGTRTLLAVLCYLLALKLAHSHNIALTR